MLIGGGEESMKRNRSRKKLLPRERNEHILDPCSSFLGLPQVSTDELVKEVESSIAEFRKQQQSFQPWRCWFCPHVHIFQSPCSAAQSGTFLQRLWVGSAYNSNAKVKVPGKTGFAGHYSGYDEYVPMIDKPIDSASSSAHIGSIRRRQLHGFSALAYVLLSSEWPIVGAACALASVLFCQHWSAC